MPSPTRVTVALCVLLVTAGCLGGVPADGSQADTPTPTAEPSTLIPGGSSPSEAPSTEDPDTPESTFVGTAGASEQPDPDKAIYVENRWNESVEIRVRVIRESTNETVYDETATFEPGADREVYNTADSTPDGVESFRVIATGRNTTESVTVETSACHGGVYVEVTERGELYPYYAIC